MTMDNYTEALKAAVTAKTEWFDSTQLPKLVEVYRLHHTCIKTIYNTLVQRSLITPDPYKTEKKISDIVSPKEEAFPEGERSIVIGSRLSEYESMLDYICTYLKFSVESLTIKRIKKLHDLNRAFSWGNLSMNSTRANTRSLAVIINDARKNMPQLAVSLLNDSLSKCAKAVGDIDSMLRELSDFHREAYKFKVRNEIQKRPDYKKECASVAEEMAEIKRLFPTVMGKEPYYSELIAEIVDEDMSPIKDTMRQNVLKRLEIQTVAESSDETEKIDPRTILIASVTALAALGAIYAEIAQKLYANIKIIEAGHNTLLDKFKRAMRKAFNLKAPPLIYNFTIIDPKKETKVQRPIEINVFVANLERKAAFYSVLENRSSREFHKVMHADPESLFGFVSKQITENNETLILLAAADEYFKATAHKKDRSSIKGLKIDLVTVKNAIVKANSRRVEYLDSIEQAQQLQKIGITNA